MNYDAIRDAAHRHSIDLSAQVEIDIVHSKQSVLLEVLRRARIDAADALAGLATVDAASPDKIRALQNRVVRFDDLAQWLRGIVVDGIAAQQALTDDEREDFQRAVGLDAFSLEEMAAHGLTERVEE